MNDENNKGSEKNSNPDNEFKSSVPHGTEIEQPGPSTATPSIPQEIPIRQE